jgi:hypothetical protein
MTKIEETIASMALLTIRQRHPTGAVDRDEIVAAVRDCVRFFSQRVDAAQIDTIVSDLETRLVVKVGRPTRLADERNHIGWYFGDRKTSRRFFKRYTDFLQQDLGWPPSAIDAIDASTDLIMEQLEDPNRDAPWDRRGLVIGHVQSGKTANYAGLINKAADAGYKLIIVLAGMHNVLRQQTQRRLDRDFLGYDTTPSNGGQGFTRIGVGELDRSLHAEHLTTQAPNGDFNRNFADNLGIGVQQRPVVLVIKKNARILENLNNWVLDVLAPRGDTEARPLLVVDDEADQASVDTGQQEFDRDEVPDLEYEPKRINGQIRRLLDAFSRSAYVAYTATPFANILIHDAAEAEGYGADLFPRSFIINLPAPSNYVGPELVFGIDGDGAVGADDALDIIRHIPQDSEGWIVTGHKNGSVPRYNGQEKIPPSLEEAILAFVLGCAARAARGQRNTHNSMLIHVSRFKNVHELVFNQVDEWLGDLKRVLRYRTGGDMVLDRLRSIWVTDFEPTSAEIRTRDIGRDLNVTTWNDVERELANAADKIRAQVVNSEMPAAIDYEANSAQGLNVIAIGGDKLSRGLTLEGLSVSYFLRASRMYDSLMQMGRWFGYRPGYVDLCRLYLTPDLELWFRHVATAAEELRDRINHMAMIGATPEEYGLRIRSHDILLVTAQNKMLHAQEFKVSFQGEAKIQTKFFADEGQNRQNANTITAFLDDIGAPVEPTPDRTNKRAFTSSEARRIWKGVEGNKVADLLGNLLFPEEAYEVNAGRLRSYVRAQLRAGELTSWTVAVLAGDGESLTVNGWSFRTTGRDPLLRSNDSGRYVVKTILSPRDEAIDLDASEFERALSETNKKRLSEGKKPATRPDGAEIRKVRGEDPKRALLLIYPLSPRKAGLPGVEIPIFGIVVSFPDSKSGRVAMYRFNKVEQRLLEVQ